MSGEGPFSSFLWGNVCISRKLLGLTSLFCRACTPAGGGRVHLSVKGSGWVEQISGIQFLPSRPNPAALSQEFQPEFSTLLWPQLASYVVSGPSFSVFSASELFLVSTAAGSCLCTQACMPGSLPSLGYLSAPLLKEFLYGSYGVVQVPGSPILPHTPSPPKSQSFTVRAGHLHTGPPTILKFLFESFLNGSGKILSALL